MSEEQGIKEQVKERYGKIALSVVQGDSCCGIGSSGDCSDPITSNLYRDSQKELLPEEAVLASFINLLFASESNGSTITPCPLE